MEEMSREEFERMKQSAGERIMQMRRESSSFYPDFISVPKKSEPSPLSEASISAGTADDKKDAPLLSVGGGQQKGSAVPFLRYLNLGEITNNPDGILLLALILLLSVEGADNTLILALAYILL